MDNVEKQAPFHLHRIAENVPFLPSNMRTKSSFKNLDGKCKYDCYIDGSTVPMKGNVWKDMQLGISTFSAIDDLNDNIQRAAHNLFKKDDELLDCCVLPRGTEVDKVGFYRDREISQGGQVVAFHTIISPSEIVCSDTFELIGMCQFPLGQWQLCEFIAGGKNSNLHYDPPNAPDDDLMNLGNELMEEYALDTDQPGNLRRLARVLQFTTENMVWRTDVQHDVLLCKILELSLSRCIDLGFPGITRTSLIGDIRSMLGNVRFWLRN